MADSAARRRALQRWDIIRTAQRQMAEAGGPTILVDPGFLRAIAVWLGKALQSAQRGNIDPEDYLPLGEIDHAYRVALAYLGTDKPEDELAARRNTKTKDGMR